MGTKHKNTKKSGAQVRQMAKQRFPIPKWVPKGSISEADLCPDCFKVVGERSRYNLVCVLGKAKEGMTVGELTELAKLRQPTVTHHLQVLRSVDAVEVEPNGRERIYRLNRDAHCFEECRIPYK